MSIKTTEEVEKKFVRYDDGAKIYSMSRCSFMKLAAESGALYRIGRMSLVNTEILDQYLEMFRQ